MKIQSIKRNYILNVLRVVSGAGVGIITMPYINRVLGAEYIGKVEYINTVMNYFLLFTALGIPMYGIREISRVRDSSSQRAKTLFELLIILGITSFIGYVLLFGIIFNLDHFTNYKDIILLMCPMIFLANIGAEWYFQGIEDQLYITLRYVGVRLLMMVLMYLYIENPSDYGIYALCIVLTTCGANILNFFVLARLLLKERLALMSGINVKRHIKPVLTIFVATISVNIYLQLDYLLIGSMVGDKYVGYYSVANKLVRFVISFITVIGAVMLPRLSYLYENDKDQYLNYLKRSFTILVLISLPFTVYFLVFAEPLISIIAGQGFTESIITMRIISPLCFIVSLAYFMGFLILYPQNREDIYTKATIFSAVFSLAVNFFAINYYQHNGAAVVGVCAEFIAIIIMFAYLKRNQLLPDIFNLNLFKLVLANIVLLIVSSIGSYFFGNDILTFIIISGLFFVLYALLLLLMREEELNKILSRFK